MFNWYEYEGYIGPTNAWHKYIEKEKKLRKRNMSEIEFRVTTHGQLQGKNMIEVWQEGTFLAGIYPHEGGIRIVSKYLDGVEHEHEYPPALIIKLSN